MADRYEHAGLARPLTRQGGLRIALLTYRGNPFCGGQGVYVRELSAALVALGHQVTVFSGQPYPKLRPGVELVAVPSLDLYREPDPFRLPRRRELRGPVDVLEVATMLTGGFPEPTTFSLRVLSPLWRRRHDFDIVHDNQGLGWGLLGAMAAGMPLVATIHHPISVDRDLEIGAAATFGRRLSLRRWYGFVRMQRLVASKIPRILTVSESSAKGLVSQFGIDPEKLAVTPLGVDTEVFHPRGPRDAGLIVTTASADVTLKGLPVLLEALAKVRTEHDARLVVVGRARPGGATARLVEELGLGPWVRFVSGVAQPELARLYAEAAVVVVPSLYEGFSLPALEAMASGAPLVVTNGGALPEVVGAQGHAAVIVDPGDAGRLAHAVQAVLGDPTLASELGRNGFARARELYSWQACALRTAEHYEEVLATRQGRGGAGC